MVHKKRQSDSLSQYEREIHSLEQFLPDETPKKRGKHKIKKEEPLFISPEDIPEDETEEQWLERQRKSYEKEAKELEELAKKGQAVALGTYKTVSSAVRGAKRLGRKFTSFVRSKLGKKEKLPVVQVFVQPKEEGEYVVYGQAVRREAPVKRPTQPIKVYLPEKERKELTYGEW